MNSTLTKLSQALINGEYNKLAKIATIELTSPAVNENNIKLYDTKRMCSKFAYNTMSMEELRLKILEKSSAGMNGTTATSNKYDKVVKSLKRKRTFEDLLNFIESENCSIPDKHILGQSMKIMSEYMNEDTSVLAPIFASIVLSKIYPDRAFAGDIDRANEFEKNLEPLVSSLIDHKKADAKMTTKQLKAQVYELLKTYPNIEHNLIDPFFHDITVSTLLNTNVNRIDFLQVGITQQSKHPMLKIDEKGVTRTYFDYHFQDNDKNTRFLKDLTPSKEETKYTELLTGDKNKLYTAFKCLQERAGLGTLDRETGSLDSRVAAPEKIARVLVEMTILCDKLNADVDNDFAFAVADPLIDIRAFIEPETFSEIINDALLDAFEIYKKEVDQNAKFEDFAQITSVSSTSTQSAIKKSREPEEVKEANEYYRRKTWQYIKATLKTIATKQAWKQASLSDSILRKVGSTINNVKERHVDAIANGNADRIEELCDPTKKSNRGGLPNLTKALMTKTASLTTDKKINIDIDALAKKTAKEIVKVVMDEYTNATTQNKDQENPTEAE